jgi:hypothetical protein
MLPYGNCIFRGQLKAIRLNNNQCSTIYLISLLVYLVS